VAVEPGFAICLKKVKKVLLKSKKLASDDLNTEISEVLADIDGYPEVDTLSVKFTYNSRPQNEKFYSEIHLSTRNDGNNGLFLKALPSGMMVFINGSNAIRKYGFHC